MITYVRGDMFTSPARVLVNTVNTVGVMGKGIAKDFKMYFPEMFEQYQKFCESGELEVGRLFYYRGPHKSILNFPTKRHWRQKSRIEDIEAGLNTFVEKYAQYSISSIAFPQLGCGNGELDWEAQVRPLMERYLGPLPISVYIHLYDGKTRFLEHRDTRRMKEWLRSEPESLPFTEVWDDIATVIQNSDSPQMDGWTVLTSSLGEEFPLVFQRDKQVVRLSGDEVREVWLQLRSFGYLSIDDLPDPLRPAGSVLLGILNALDYIERAQFSISRAFGDVLASEELDMGIRLIPRSSTADSSSQLELAGLR